MNFKNGVIISEGEVYDRDPEKIPRMSLLAARKIYEKIPYRGRILKGTDEELIINLGLYDGLRNGDILYADDTYDVGVKGKYTLKRKMLIKIDEADTIVSRAKAVDPDDMVKLHEGVEVFPLAKRRAKRVE
jgi:hypothetical protein